MSKYHKKDSIKLKKSQLNKKNDPVKARTVFIGKVKIGGLISQINLRLNRKKKIVIEEKNQITKNIIKKESCHS